VALPVVFVGFLVWIKKLVEGTSGFKAKVIEPIIPDNDMAFTPLTFGDYVTALTAQRECTGPAPKPDMGITGMPFQGSNWQVPLVKCDSRLCETVGSDASAYCTYSIVAVTGTDPGGLARAQDMRDYILDVYPALQDATQLPFDFAVVQVFGKPADIDTYVKRADYGASEVPKIAMGIVWEGNDELSYVYSLRQNSTNFNNPVEAARPGVTTTPDTGTDVKPFARDDSSVCGIFDGASYQGPLEASCTGQYLYNGVLTFQRLVGDYILNRTGAADAGYFVAEAGVTYVQFPTKAYTEQGFYGAIAGTSLSARYCHDPIP
jgi:hypothetical protein